MRVIFHFYNLQLIFDFSSKGKKVILFYCQAAYNQEVGSFQAGKTIEYAPVPGKLEKFNSSLSDIFLPQTLLHFFVNNVFQGKVFVCFCNDMKHTSLCIF